MKTFKEFQTESYSRIDENWMLRLGGSVLGGNATDKVYDNRVDQSNKGLDLTKHKKRKGNDKVRTALNIAGSVAGWNADKIVKPALTGAYNVAKFGVNKVALPATAWAFKQVFGGGVDRI